MSVKRRGYAVDGEDGVAVGGRGRGGVGAGGGEERGEAVAAVTATRRRGWERTALVAAFAAVYLIWGSTYLAIAWAVEGAPPLLMIGGRCLLAGGALYGWSRLRGGGRPAAGEWGSALVGGVLLFVTGQAVLAWSETRIPSGAASLLIATEPLFIAVLGWRGGRLTGRPAARPRPAALVAVLLGFLGVAVLVLPGASGEGGGLDPVGAGAAVLASFSWSVGVLRSRPRPGTGAGRWAGMQLLMAGVVLLVVSPLAGESPGSLVSGHTLRSALAFLYLVVFGSIVAFAAYVWLLGRVGASRLSSHAYVNPLVAVALGVGLNGERLGATGVLATVAILGSVALLLGAGDQPAAPARPKRQRAAMKPAAETARSHR